MFETKRKSGPLVATVTALAIKAAAGEVVFEDVAFQSAGKRISMSVARPQSAASLPAILVLHGAGGVDAGNAYVRQITNLVAASGYATFLVEYFDRTGTLYADEPMMRANAEAWLGTVRDAITAIARRDDVDPTRIGVFGYSLGGYLAIAQGARDERIGAIVELAGGIEPALAGAAKRLPPVLIIHGKEDRRVPFERARELEAVARRLGGHVETQYFAEERHILSPLAAFQAIGCALEFFNMQLGAVRR